MRKIKRHIAVFDPLNVAISIKEIGGSVKQNKYEDSNLFIPNRKITPLTLQPCAYITDPNKIIPAGDKIGSFASGAWYENTISEANRITAIEADATTETPYAIGANYSLVVRKNVEQNSPVTLLFEGAYYDSRRGSNVPVQASVLLTTTSNSESEPAPSLSLSLPSSFVFNPLQGLANISIEAQMFRQNALVPPANVMFKWYATMKGEAEWLLGSRQPDFIYVSGQGTSILTVNPEFFRRVRITCRAQYYEGAAPATFDDTAVMAETKLIRKFPKSLDVDIRCNCGTFIRPEVKTLTYTAEVRTNKGVISNPEEYFSIKWLQNMMTAGSQDVVVGRGKEITLSRAAAGLDNPGAKPNIMIDFEELPPYGGITDNSGNYIVDQNGNYLVGR